MRTFHKILVLVSLIIIVRTGIDYFMGAEINEWSLLAAALVLVHNLRELQFENMKDLLNVTRYNSGVIVDAIRQEFGTEGLRRIENRSLDILAERAPEEIREEAQKLTEAVKKLNNKEAN